jgi:hypothetical protein
MCKEESSIYFLDTINNGPFCNGKKPYLKMYYDWPLNSTRDVIGKYETFL